MATAAIVRTTNGGDACGSPLRGRPEELCGNRAGERTDHEGQGRCWLHGGKALVRHGRYSMIKSERLQAIFAQLEASGDPLDLTPDVNALRMLYVDYINRYEENSEALLAWWHSWTLKHIPREEIVLSLEHVIEEWAIAVREGGVEPTERQEEDLKHAMAFIEYYRSPDVGRPRTILDISDAKGILAEVGKMVERVEKIRSQNAVSRPELNRIYQEMWRAVDALVEDDLKKEKIKEAWLGIAL